MRFSDELQIPACETLWRAVMRQMQADLLTWSAKPDKQKDKRNAQHWFTHRTREVQIVCDYAGLSYVDEMKQFKRAQTKQDSKSIMFADALPTKPQQISFLPALLHGFQPLQFCKVKPKRQRMNYVQNLHQLELWEGQHE